MPPSPGLKRVSSKTKMASLIVGSVARRLSSVSISSLSGSNRELSRARRGSITVIPDIEPIQHDGLAKSEEWANVQKAIWSIFQSEDLTATEHSTAQQSVRRIAETELGPFIYDYYKNKLMPKGMEHLAEEVQSHTDGHLAGLEVVWNKFYQETLSSLKIVLHRIPIKEHNIRVLTLLGFRDYVLLKTDIEDIFASEDQLEVTPFIQQMLLVLQSVRISDPPSENFIRLERLVGRAVVPYIGYLGIYNGSSEPEIPSVNYSNVIKKSYHVRDDITRVPTQWKTRSRQHSFRAIKTLEPVKEMTQREFLQLHLTSPRHDGPPAPSPSVAIRRLRDNKGRRHSCDILMN